MYRLVLVRAPTPMSWVAGQALRMREGRLVSFADVSANHGLGDILVLLLLDIGLRASVGLAKKPHHH